MLLAQHTRGGAAHPPPWTPGHLLAPPSPFASSLRGKGFHMSYANRKDPCDYKINTDPPPSWQRGPSPKPCRSLCPVVTFPWDLKTHFRATTPQAGISTSSGDEALQATGITQYAATLGEKKCPSAVPHIGRSRSCLALPEFH